MKEFYFSYFFNDDYRSYIVQADSFAKAWRCFCKWCLKNEEEKSMIKVNQDYSFKEIDNRGFPVGDWKKANVDDYIFKGLNLALKNILDLVL